MTEKKNRKPLARRVFKGLCWTAGVVVGLLLVLQIVLSTGLATGLVNRFAANYVKGELSFGKVSANVFRNFPAVSLSLDDAMLTYPHERYAECEAAHPEVVMLRSGCGREGVDTLASFRQLTVAVDLWALIGGTIDVRKLALDAPRAFVKLYDDGRTNLDILPLSSSEEEEDEQSSGLPAIKLRHVAFTGHPDIVFCDVKDTLHARLLLRDLSLKGRFNTSDMAAMRGRLSVDSLKVMGRMKTDTLLFALDRLELKDRSRKAELSLSARAYALTRSFGRLAVPMNLDAVASFPEDSVLTVNLESMKASLAGIPLTAHGLFSVLNDGILMDAEAAIDGCDISDILHRFGKSFWDGADEVSTDARLQLTALAQGEFSSSKGLVPEFAAELLIPKASIAHKGYNLAGTVELDANMTAEANGPVNATLDCFSVDIPGLGLDAKLAAKDLLGSDPVFDIDANLLAALDRMCDYLPKDSGYSAEGQLEAILFGKIRSSQLNAVDFAKADVSGLLLSDGLSVVSEKDSLNASLGGLEIQLSALGNKRDDSVKEGARMLALSVDVDTLSADYKQLAQADASRVQLVAQNSADILNEKKKADFYPFMGDLSIGGLKLRDADSSTVVLRNSKNTFRISPKNDNPAVPVLRLSSNNGALFVRAAKMRAGLRNFNMDATAAMNTFERRLRRKAMLDSLANVYPDIPKDSLFRHHFRSRASSREVPEWMQDQELNKQDIQLSLSGNLRKYYMNWDVNGKLAVSRGFLATPYFPLRNSVSDFSGTFNNDRINLDSFTLKSGVSDISAKGSVYGLRRALLAKGVIGMDLNLTSDLLDANELLTAYEAGSKVASSSLGELAALDDDAFQEACAIEVCDSLAQAPSLIVVPGNVNAKINLEANRIVYSTLDIDWMESEIAMKERCLQIANTVATSNMGDIYFEAFYSTRTRQNIKCGFNLNLVDITAEKVIELVPQVDTIMPMLKSFYGMLDCTLAATASLDENMNILIPSVNGVTRIVGKDLEIRNDKDITKIARLLMFKNKKIIHVDRMSVEGLLQDSRIEIFPFMLNVDRYKLALSGIQNMDSSFKYHVSVIKSPLLFKFGINLFGDFDKWKFRLGKAKYKSAKKVPAFTKVIDQATLNLTNSIHDIFEKGVDAAVAENNSQKAINEFKENTGYVSVAEEPIDSLDGKAAKYLEQYEAMEKGVSELGLDFDELTPESYDALDEETRAKLDALGVDRKFLVSRQEEASADDDEE